MVTKELLLPATGTGTTPQYSAAWELPTIGPDDDAAMVLSCTTLTGGTSPTVIGALEFSLDGVSWFDYAVGTSPHTFSAVGAQLVTDTVGTIQMSALGYVRFIRLRGVGGGTAAPTSWVLSLKVAVQPSNTAHRYIEKVAITATSAGTTKQVFSWTPLPEQGASSRAMIAWRCDALSGGTSPTVTSGIEGSVDGSTWVSLAQDLGAKTWSATGGDFEPGLVGVKMPWPYLRLTATGGGTAPPTNFTITAWLVIVSQ